MRICAALLSGTFTLAIFSGLFSDAPSRTVHAASPISDSVSVAASYPETVEKILTGWDSYSEVVELGEDQISLNDFRDLFSELTSLHGEYFFVESTYYATYTAEGYMHAVKFSYANTEAEMNEKRSAYERKINEIIREVSPAWTEEETALYLHDYLATHVAYDETYSRYTAYDALIDGTAVCQGYALAYHDLLEAAGITSYTVTSDALNHIWNLVTIGDSEYYVDVTWDDPTADFIGRCKHNCFLLTAEELYANSHNSTDWILYGIDVKDVNESTQFSDGFWKDAIGQICPLNDQWVMLTNNTTSADVTIVDYSRSAVQNKVIYSFSEIWYLWDSTLSYWTGYFSGIGVYDGFIYLNDRDEIFSIDSNGKNRMKERTLNASESKSGYYYGFYLDPDGTLTYAIAQDPNSGSVGTTFQIKTRAVDCDPYETGDVNGDCVINTSDAVLVLKDYSARMLNTPTTLSEEAILAGDIDGDGILTSTDAVWILKYYSQALISDSVTWDEIYKP